MHPETVIVLPTYNEVRNLGQLVPDLRTQCPNADILIIDDGSPDGTGALADELARTIPGVRVIHRSGKLGLGSAHVRGMDEALAGGYRILVTMDCDYTHRPQDVPLLIAALKDKGVDMVIGSRYHHPEGIITWPLWRRAVTRTAHLFTRFLLGIPFDATNAFRAYSTAALRRVPYQAIQGDGYSFMFEMVFACMEVGLRVDQVPVVLPIRQAGESKISRMEVAKAVSALGRLSLARVGRLRQTPAARTAEDNNGIQRQ